MVIQMKTALVMTDKLSQDVFHVMVCKDEQTAKQYIDNNPKIDYKVIPNWDFVCEAVHRYNQETYYMH